jgi:hypothetical protein
VCLNRRCARDDVKARVRGDSSILSSSRARRRLRRTERKGALLDICGYDSRR